MDKVDCVILHYDNLLNSEEFNKLMILELNNLKSYTVDNKNIYDFSKTKIYDFEMQTSFASTIKL